MLSCARHDRTVTVRSVTSCIMMVGKAQGNDNGTNLARAATFPPKTCIFIIVHAHMLYR